MDPYRGSITTQRVPSAEWYPPECRNSPIEQDIITLLDPEDDIIELDESPTPESEDALESWNHLATKETSVKYFLIAKTPDWLYPHGSGPDDQWIRNNYRGELTELERKMMIDLLTALRLTSLNHLPEELRCTLKASTNDSLADRVYYSQNDQPPPATRFFVKYPFTDTCEEFITTVESVSMVKPLGNFGYFERGTDEEDFESMRKQVGYKYDVDYDRYYHPTQLSTMQEDDRIIRDYILLSFHIQGLHVHGSCDLWKTNEGLWYLGFSNDQRHYARVDVRGPLRWTDSRRLKFAYFTYKHFWDFEHDEFRKSKGKPPLHDNLARKPNQPSNIPSKQELQSIVRSIPSQNGTAVKARPNPPVQHYQVSQQQIVDDSRNQQFRGQLPVKTVQPMQQNGVPNKMSSQMQNGNSAAAGAKQMVNGNGSQTRTFVQNGTFVRNGPQQAPVQQPFPKTTQRPGAMSVTQRQLLNAAAAQQMRALSGAPGTARQQIRTVRVVANGINGQLEPAAAHPTDATRVPAQAGPVNGNQAPAGQNQLVSRMGWKRLPDGTMKTVTVLTKPGSSVPLTIQNGSRSSAVSVVQSAQMQSQTANVYSKQQRRPTVADTVETPQTKRVRLAENGYSQQAVSSQTTTYIRKPTIDSTNRMSASSLSNIQANFAQQLRHKEPGLPTTSASQSNSMYKPVLATFPGNRVPGRDPKQRIVVPAVRRIGVVAPLQNETKAESLVSKDLAVTPSTSSDYTPPTTSAQTLSPIKYVVVRKPDIAESKPEALPPVVLQPKTKGRRAGRPKTTKEEDIQQPVQHPTPVVQVQLDVAQPSTIQPNVSQQEATGTESGSGRPKRERKGTSWRPREEREYMSFDEPRRYNFNANNKRQTKMEQIQEIVKIKGKPRGRTHKNIDKDIERDVASLMDAVLDEVDKTLEPDYYIRITEDIMEELLDGAEKIANRKRGRKKKETRYLGCKAKIHKAEDGLPVSPRTEKKPKANLYVPQEVIIPQLINQAVGEVMEFMLTEITNLECPPREKPSLSQLNPIEKKISVKSICEEKPTTSSQTNIARQMEAVSGLLFLANNSNPMHMQQTAPVIVIGAPAVVKVEKTHGPDMAIFQQTRETFEKKMEGSKVSEVSATITENKPVETKKIVVLPTEQPKTAAKEVGVIAEVVKQKPEQKDRLPATPEKEDKPKRKRRKKLLFTQTKKRKVQIQKVIENMEKSQLSPTNELRKKTTKQNLLAEIVEKTKPAEEKQKNNSSWDVINQFNFWNKPIKPANEVTLVDNAGTPNSTLLDKKHHDVTCTIQTTPAVTKVSNILEEKGLVAKKSLTEVSPSSLQKNNVPLTVDISAAEKKPETENNKILSPLNVQVSQGNEGTPRGRTKKESITPGSKQTEVSTVKLAENSLVSPASSMQKRTDRRSVSLPRIAPRELTEEDLLSIKNCMQAVVNNVVMADNMDRIANAMLRRKAAAAKRTSLPDVSAYLLAPPNKNITPLLFGKENRNVAEKRDAQTPNPSKYLGHLKAPEKRQLKTEYPLLPPKYAPVEKPQIGIREQLQFQRRVHFRNANLFANLTENETPKQRRERLQPNNEKNGTADKSSTDKDLVNGDVCENKRPDPMTYLGHIATDIPHVVAHNVTADTTCDGLNAQMEFQRKVHFERDIFDTSNMPHSLVYQAIMNKTSFARKDEDSDDESSVSSRSDRSESHETESQKQSDSEQEEDESSNSSDSVNFSNRPHKHTFEYIQSVLRKEEGFGGAPAILSEYSHIVTAKKDIPTVEEKIRPIELNEETLEIMELIGGLVTQVVKQEDHDDYLEDDKKFKREDIKLPYSSAMLEGLPNRFSPDLKKQKEETLTPSDIKESICPTENVSDSKYVVDDLALRSDIKELVEDLTTQCDVKELLDEMIMRCEVTEKQENETIRSEVEKLLEDLIVISDEIVPCLERMVCQVVQKERLTHAKGCVQLLSLAEQTNTAQDSNRNKTPDSGISSTSEQGDDSGEDSRSPKMQEIFATNTEIATMSQQFAKMSWRKISEPEISQESDSDRESCVDEGIISPRKLSQKDGLHDLSLELNSLQMEEPTVRSWLINTEEDENPFATSAAKYRREQTILSADSPLIKPIGEEVVIEDSPASLSVVEEMEPSGDIIMRQLAAIVSSGVNTPVPTTPTKLEAISVSPLLNNLDSDLSGDYIMRELADIVKSREQTPLNEPRITEDRIVQNAESVEASVVAPVPKTKPSELIKKNLVPETSLVKSRTAEKAKPKKKRMTVFETEAALEQGYLQELDNILRTRENTPVADEIPEPVPQPVVEPVAKPVVELITKPVVELVTKPVATPVLEAIPKPMTKHVPAKVNSPEVVGENIDEPMSVAEVCEVISEEQCFQEIEDILRTPEYSPEEDVDSKPRDLFEEYDITVHEEVTLTDCRLDSSSKTASPMKPQARIEVKETKLTEMLSPVVEPAAIVDQSPTSIIFDDMSDEEHEEDPQRVQLEAVAQNLQSSLSFTPTIVKNMQSLTPETSPILASESSLLNAAFDSISSPLSAGSYIEKSFVSKEEQVVTPIKKKTVSAEDRALSRRNLCEANCDELYKFAFEDGEEEISEDEPEEYTYPEEQPYYEKKSLEQNYTSSIFKQKDLVLPGPSTSKSDAAVDRTQQAATSALGMQKILFRLGWFNRQTRIIDDLVPEVHCVIQKPEGDEVFYDVSHNHHIDLLSTVKLKDGRTISKDVISFMRKLVKIWDMFGSSPFYPEECPLKLKNIEMIITDKKVKIELNKPFTFKTLTVLQSVLAKFTLKETCAIGLGIKTPEYQVMLRIAAINSLTLKINKNEIRTKDPRDDYHQCAMAINLPHQYEELLKPIFTRYRSNAMQRTPTDMDIDNGKAKIMVGSIFSVPVGTAETDPTRPEETFKTEILDQHWTHVSKKSDSSSLFRKQKCKVRDRYDAELQEGRMFVDAEEPLIATSLVHTCISGTFAIWYNRFNDTLYLVDSEYYWCEDDYTGDPISNPFTKARKNYNIPQRHGSFGDDNAYGYKPRSRAAKARGAGTYNNQPEQYEADMLMLLGLMKHTTPGFIFVSPKLLVSGQLSVDFARQNTCALPMVNVITELTGEIRFVKLMLNSLLDGLQLQLRSAKEEIAALYRAQVLFMRLFGNVWMFNILNVIRALWNPVTCYMWNTAQKQEKMKQQAMEIIEICKRELLDPVKVLRHFEQLGRVSSPLDYRKAAMKQLSKIMLPDAMLKEYDVLIPWQEAPKSASVATFGNEMNEVAWQFNRLSMENYKNMDLGLLLSQLSIKPTGYEDMYTLDTSINTAHPICKFAVPRIVEELQLGVRNGKNNVPHFKSLDWRTSTTASVAIVQNAIAELIREEQVDARDNIFNAREHWRYNQRECGSAYSSADMLCLEFSSIERSYKTISVPRNSEPPIEEIEELNLEDNIVPTEEVSLFNLLEQKIQSTTVVQQSESDDSTSSSDSGDSASDNISLPSTTTVTAPKTDSGIGSIGSRASRSVRFADQAESVISADAQSSLPSVLSHESTGSGLLSLPSIDKIRKTKKTQFEPSTSTKLVHSEAERAAMAQQLNKKDPFFKTPFRSSIQGVMDYKPQKYQEDHPSEQQPGTSKSVDDTSVSLKDSLFAAIGAPTKLEPTKKSGIKRPTFKNMSPTSGDDFALRKECSSPNTANLMHVFAACSVVDKNGANESEARVSQKQLSHNLDDDLSQQLAQLEVKHPTVANVESSFEFGDGIEDILQLVSGTNIVFFEAVQAPKRSAPQPSLVVKNAFERRMEERSQELKPLNIDEKKIPIGGTEEEKMDYAAWVKRIVDNAEIEKQRVMRMCEPEKALRKQEKERQTKIKAQSTPERPASAPGWTGSSLSDNYNETHTLGMARYNRDLTDGGPPKLAVNAIGQRRTVPEPYLSRNNTPASIAPLEMEHMRLDDFDPFGAKILGRKRVPHKNVVVSEKVVAPPKKDAAPEKKTPTKKKDDDTDKSSKGKQDLGDSSADEIEDDETFF